MGHKVRNNRFYLESRDLFKVESIVRKKFDKEITINT